MELHVEPQPQLFGLRHHVDEVGFSIVSDIELEELLGDTKVESRQLSVKCLKQTRHCACLGEIRMLFDAVHLHLFYCISLIGA